MVAVSVGRQVLARLKLRFATLLSADADTTGLQLPFEAVLAMPELRGFPFVPLVAQRILEHGDSTKSTRDRVSFATFLTILAVLSENQTVAVKRRGIEYQMTTVRLLKAADERCGQCCLTYLTQTTTASSLSTIVSPC